MFIKNAKSKKQKNLKSTIVFFSIIILLTFPFSLFSIPFFETVNADMITNENYSVDVNNIDTNPQPTTPPPKPQVLGIQTPKSEFTTGPNYTIIPSTNSFSVNLSQNTVDYGILSSTNPVIRSSEISFSDTPFGAQILAYENHPLESSKNVIPDTTCDNGNCSSLTAALWNNTLTYGFGYRCDSTLSNTCDSQFSISNYFKRYPETSLNETAEPIAISYGNGGNVKTTITYKVNIAGTQKTGAYYNSITYLAVPGF